MLKSIGRIASVQLAILLLPLLLFLTLTLVPVVSYLVSALSRVDILSVFFCGFIATIVGAGVVAIGLISFRLVKFGTSSTKFKEVLINLVVSMSIAGFIFRVVC